MILLGKKFLHLGKPGRKQVVSPDIDNKISTVLIEAARQGVGVSRRQLLRRAGTLKNKIKQCTKTPGKDWFEGLKK